MCDPIPAMSRPTSPSTLSERMLDASERARRAERRGHRFVAKLWHDRANALLIAQHEADLEDGTYEQEEYDGAAYARHCITGLQAEIARSPGLVRANRTLGAPRMARRPRSRGAGRPAGRRVARRAAGRDSGSDGSGPGEPALGGHPLGAAP